MRKRRRTGDHLMLRSGASGLGAQGRINNGDVRDGAGGMWAMIGWNVSVWSWYGSGEVGPGLIRSRGCFFCMALTVYVVLPWWGALLCVNEIYYVVYITSSG